MVTRLPVNSEGTTHTAATGHRSDAPSFGWSPSMIGLTNVRPLASNHNSIVWRCTQPAIRRDVAVKLITSEASRTLRSNEARQSEEHEFLTLGRLSWHPNIVTLHAAGFTDSAMPYIVTEFAEFGSLADLLRRGRVDITDLIALGWQLADALAETHGQGVIHRDVKPSNILLPRPGHPLLADFGLARWVEGTATEHFTAGTLRFLAPELLDDEAPSEASDTYAFGATLWSLIHGTLPHGGQCESPAAIARRVLFEPLTVDNDACPDDQLRNIINGMLNPQPEQRPSCASIASALEELQHGRASLQRQALTQPAHRGRATLHQPPASAPANTGCQAAASPSRQSLQPPQPRVGLASRLRARGRPSFPVLLLIGLLGALTAHSCLTSAAKQSESGRPAPLEKPVALHGVAEQ